MSRGGVRPYGRRAPAAGAVVVTALLAGVASPVGHAQPAPGAELDRAKDLYASGEAAMKDGRYADAVRDYGAAYELSKDPALFFKIARANERAGKCDVALIYYARYLHDGRPAARFVTATRERIVACGGDPQGTAAPPIAPPTAAAPSAGSDTTAPPRPPGAGSAATGNAAPAGGPVAPAGGSAAPATGSAAPAAGSAAPAAGSAAIDSAGSASGSTAIPALRNQDKAAWLLAGSSIALITLGGVLAYASSSSESDIRDLYVGFAGQPATFDAQTRKRYDDLIDQGHQYQHLSWAAFGLAGATAVTAAVLFVVGRPGEAAPQRITPVVTTTSAGVAVRF
jgi:hypothetical protein